MENQNCSIVVSSFDAYQDVWKPFFTFFFKYWPDCPFPVYLISNYLDYQDDRVKTLKVGEDKNWTSNIKIALENIESDYFIFFIEDYFLNKRVDTKRIEKLLEIAQSEDVAYLRLYPSPGPDRPFKDYSEVGEIDSQAPYRTSLMSAIWNKKDFLDLLVDGENAWEVELKGTERSRSCQKHFLSVKRSKMWNRNNNPAVSYYSTAIKKGVWDLGAVNFCKKHGVKLDTNKRSVQSKKNYFLYRIRKFPIIKHLLILKSKIK